MMTKTGGKRKKCLTRLILLSLWFCADEGFLKMAQESESIEQQVLRQHSASFSKAITELTPVANRLREVALIDSYTYGRVTEKASGLSQIEKATELIKVLEKTISVLSNDKKRREKFELILSIFNEFIPLNLVADEAKEAYGEEIGWRTLP